MAHTSCCTVSAATKSGFGRLHLRRLPRLLSHYLGNSLSNSVCCPKRLSLWSACTMLAAASRAASALAAASQCQCLMPQAQHAACSAPQRPLSAPAGGRRPPCSHQRHAQHPTEPQGGVPSPIHGGCAGHTRGVRLLVGPQVQAGMRSRGCRARSWARPHYACRCAPHKQSGPLQQPCCLCMQPRLDCVLHEQQGSGRQCLLVYAATCGLGTSCCRLSWHA